MRPALALTALIAFAAPARADTVVADWSGAGRMTTRSVTFSGPWELQWKAEGLFLVHLIDTKGLVVHLLVSQPSGGQGSASWPQGGTYYIAVNALAPGLPAPS